uniref:YbaB/EbfC family DNA-binding protein n=1 Tax=Ammonifex degensii TaxID=42838 RepID=A0A7C1F7F7_9THEO
MLILLELEGLGRFLGEISKVKEALKGIRVEVAEGPVSLTLNGLQEVVRVRVKPEAVKDLVRLESWLGACFNKGVVASRRAAKEEIERLTGWTIPTIPGLT